MQALAQDRGPAARAARQLTLFDTEGNLVRTLGQAGPWFTPRFSPDGTRVAASLWTPGEGEDIWIFDLTTGLGEQITDGEGNGYPVWSPDGRELAYIGERGSDWNIYRRAASGEGDAELVFRYRGTPIYLFDWSPDGRFLSFSEVLYRDDVPVESALRLLPLEGDGLPIDARRSDAVLVSGKLSPDSRFLVYRSSETGRQEIYVQSIAHLTAPGDTDERIPPPTIDRWQVSTDGGTLPSSWTRDRREIHYFNPDRELVVVALEDGDDLRFGQPRRLSTPILPSSPPARTADLSRDGQYLVLAVPVPPPLFQITIFDRDGRVVARPGEPQAYDEATLSPDGSRVAVVRFDPETNQRDLWVIDVDTGDGIRLTTDGSRKARPLWSADGRALAYADAFGPGIYLRPLGDGGDDSDNAQLLISYPPGYGGGLDDLSADGRYLSRDGGSIVNVVSLVDGDPDDPVEVEVVREAFDAFGARFSPHGRYLAYLADESGRFEVYVRPFDFATAAEPPARTWQVSNDGSIGGIVWRADGRELFYLARDPDSLDVRVMAVEVSTTPEFEAGAPRFLFQVSDTLAPAPRNEGLVVSGDGQRIGSVGKIVSGDGQRFVFLLPVTVDGRR